MKLPKMGTIRQRTDGVTHFGGYDHRLKIQDGAFYDMRNMTGKLLPVISARQRRAKLRTLEKPNGLFAHDSLCWVDGTDFCYDGQYIGQVEDSPKQMARMGAYVLIWPDAAYYNTQTGEFGGLGAKAVTQGEISWHLCRMDGTLYPDYALGDEAPGEPQNGAYWLDTSQQPNVLKCYSMASGMWVSVPTVYTRISAEGIGKAFGQYDGVKITGMEEEALNGTFYLVDRGDDWITVIALVSQAGTQTAPATVEREIPRMDYVCELDNRIWGCSSEKHEIYASALGDAKNWNQFLGQATDSYAVTVGSAGAFTGACAHLGSVLFFKENAIHRVMGYKPENFQLDTTECRGVQKGCAASLCTVNETLLYKSRSDVCRFGSALPAGISGALGEEAYGEAVGGARDRVYYLCMRKADGPEAGQPTLFAYDTESGVWMREDEADVMYFAQLDGELYMLLRNGELWSVGGGGLERFGDEGARMEERVAWMIETGDIGLDEPCSRYIRGIQLHAQCELGTTVALEIRCDMDSAWTEVYRAAPVRLSSLTIPYAPRRCRTIRLRLSGEGDFRLYSIVKRTEAGSDVYRG